MRRPALSLAERNAQNAEKDANGSLPGVVWMQYPWLRIGGSGSAQLRPLHGCTSPFTVNWRPPAKLLQLPEASCEVVSKQAAPVPRAPDWKLAPSATVNWTGLLHNPEHGMGCA